ncbi:4Fe-4S dicluster domain-containing protein, partial [Candidatus Poribacteria bacterium]
PQEIPISSVLRMKSFAKRFPEERFYGGVGQNMVEKAETCIDCGECEERCPYELPVRDMMQENVVWYNEQMALR